MTSNALGFIKPKQKKTGIKNTVQQAQKFMHLEGKK